MTVRLPAEPSGAITLHRVSKTAGKGKADTVVGQPVSQHKKFRSLTADTLPLLKNLPNLIPSLQMFPAPETEGNCASIRGGASYRGGLRLNRASSRQRQ